MIDNMEIFELNPIVAYKNKINYKLTEEKEKFLDGLELNLENKRLSNRRDILETDVFKDLKQMILSHIKRYEKNVCGWGDEVSLKITESWYSMTKPGRDHDRHHHPNSMLSGVYYFTVPGGDENTDHQGLLLESSYDIFKNFCFEHLPQNHNKYNTRETFIPLSSGDLLLFPSWMFHSVKENKSNSSRKVLAFNTFISGNITCSNDYPTNLFL
tara:strand:- start:208 stop:846 length:639 start_codon:yes stop_codon:yes gene_type:complete